MRRIIAAMHVSLDGYIEGPGGELDWVDSWEDSFGVAGNVDGLILGGRMYPGYEQYWQAVRENPRGPLPLTGRSATTSEVEYADFAGRTPHIVLSSTLKSASWTHTSIVPSVDDIRRMKQAPGGDMHAVGGASLVSSLMNAGLVDELRIVLHPVVLGGGKALFADVTQRHALTLLGTQPVTAGAISLVYGVCRDR